MLHNPSEIGSTHSLRNIVVRDNNVWEEVASHLLGRGEGLQGSIFGGPVDSLFRTRKETIFNMILNLGNNFDIRIIKDEQDFK